MRDWDLQLGELETRTRLAFQISNFKSQMSFRRVDFRNFRFTQTRGLVIKNLSRRSPEDLPEPILGLGG